MTYEELIAFVERDMRMSHVYQPLLVRALVDAGGMATVRQLAVELLLQDESQILYYEDRIRKMPLPVLRRRGVVESSDGLVRLTASRLTYEERAHVKMLCEQRLQEFVRRRGLSTWDNRVLETEPVPGRVRYEVLLEAGGRCALCRTTEGRLEVDHIVPRSKGGSNEKSNLQVLCGACNRGKSNLDDTDLRASGGLLTT